MTKRCEILYKGESSRLEGKQSTKEETKTKK